MNYSVQPSVAGQVAVNTSSGALLTNVGGNNTMLTAVASVLNAPAALPNIPCNEISIFAVTNLQLSSGGSSAKINLVNGSIYTFVVSNANMIYLNNSQSSGALAVNYVVFS